MNNSSNRVNNSDHDVQTLTKLETDLLCQRDNDKLEIQKT